MSLLDEVKVELLARIDDIENEEKSIKFIEDDIKEKKSEKSEISNKIKIKEESVTGLQTSLKLLKNLQELYEFIDNDLEEVNNVVDKYYELVGNMKLFENRGKEENKENTDKVVDWVCSVGGIDIEEDEESEVDESKTDKSEINQNKIKQYSSCTLSDILDIHKRIIAVNMSQIVFIYNNVKNEREHRIVQDALKYIINRIESAKRICTPINELIKNGYVTGGTQIEELKAIFGNKNDIKNKIQIIDLEIEKIKNEIKELKNFRKAIEIEITKTEDKRKKVKNNVSRRRTDIKKTKNEIEDARTIEDLGYKSAEEINKKLKINTDGYVVIPIPDKAKNINDIFCREVDVELKISYVKTKATYETQIAYGSVNSDFSIKDNNSALIIPLNNFEKEDIVGIKNNKLQIKLPRNLSNVKAIIPDNREFECPNIVRYSKESSIKQEIKDTLGNRYSNNPFEYMYYKDFSRRRGNESLQEKQARDDAISRVLATDTYIEREDTDTVYADGERYSPNINQINKYLGGTRINDEKINEIIDSVNEYLENAENEPSVKIDSLCGEIIKEYMNINKKTRAEYYLESGTQFRKEDDLISIKPRLPQNSDKIIKRFTRKNEDIVYKTMKLAMLINKVAHLNNISSEQQQLLYNLKVRLIERTVNLADGKENINICADFDTSKDSYVVDLEIPGYAVVSLHVRNVDRNFTYKLSRLKQNKKIIDRTEDNESISNTNDFFGMHILLIDGVNEDLLDMLIKMSKSDRMSFYLNMMQEYPDVFKKLLIRMGYSLIDFNDQEKRKEIIAQICCDTVLEQKLAESKRR